MVLGLDASIPDTAWRILGAIDVASASREVIFVCRASALAGVTPPPDIKVVPVPEAEPAGESHARLLGVSHASGDLVRITTLADLEAAWHSGGARDTGEWIRKLEARGATRPPPPGGNGKAR